jgi:hypothetical protein
MPNGIDLSQTQIELLKILMVFLGGGTMGALIKQYFDKKRVRIQTISYCLELNSLYESTSNKLVNSHISIREGETEYKFEMLFSGSLWFYNTGNIDFSDFKFGLTLNEEFKFIQIRPSNLDRHHQPVFSNLPNLKNQISQFDIELKPFNREEKYSFEFLISANDFVTLKNSFQISTSHPVKFEKVKSGNEVLSLFSKALITLYGQGIPIQLRQ